MAPEIRGVSGKGHGKTGFHHPMADGKTGGLMTQELCTIRSECSFYLRQDLTTAEKVLKGIYCENAIDICEIRKLREAGKSVPTGMLPDGTMAM
ncbi:hypothetical protein ES705_47873 [subsurface metagenome]